MLLNRIATINGTKALGRSFGRRSFAQTSHLRILIQCSGVRIEFLFQPTWYAQNTEFIVFLVANVLNTYIYSLN